MAVLRVRKVIRALPGPAAGTASNSPVVRPNFAIELLREENGFSQIRAVAPGGLVIEGWVPSGELVEKTVAPTSEEIDIPAFAELVLVAARQFETSAEYLLATAWHESRIKNVRNSSSGASGPFQFLPTTWAGQIDKVGSAFGITLADIDRWESQPIVAAAFTRENMDGLMGIGALEGRLPTGAELYLAHFLGLPAARKVLAAPRAETIDRPLLDLYQNRPDRDVYVRDKIIGAHPKLLVVEGGGAKPIESVLTTLADVLNTAYAEVIRHIPMPAVAGAGEAEPAWMSVARAELAKGVAEDMTRSNSNPEVEKYYAATRLGGAHTDDVPWCAAFVSYCMENSGDERVRAANKHSARAADWLSWGEPLEAPVAGCVAVFEPSSPRTSGHVGFITGADAGTVTLLGGNQGSASGPDRVCEVKRSALKVRGYRML
ncbi:MAG: TIGR02594 family protein [Geminicoccaceae bacterium]